MTALDLTLIDNALVSEGEGIVVKNVVARPAEGYDDPNAFVIDFNVFGGRDMSTWNRLRSVMDRAMFGFLPSEDRQTRADAFTQEMSCALLTYDAARVRQAARSTKRALDILGNEIRQAADRNYPGFTMTGATNEDGYVDPFGVTPDEAYGLLRDLILEAEQYVSGGSIAQALSREV